MILDTALLNTQSKVDQSREKSSALPYIEKEVL